MKLERWVLSIAAASALRCDPSRAIPFRPDAAETACAVEGSERSALWAETTCDTGRCDAVLTRDRCSVAIELSGLGCASHRLDGTLAPDGAIRAMESSFLGRCVLASGAVREGARLSLECRNTERDCRVDLYTPATDAPIGVVEELALLDVPFGVPVHAGSRGPIVGLDALRGYLGSMAVLEGSRVAVATYDGVFESPRCDTARRSAIVFADGASLVRTGSAAIDGCLPLIARDPLGAGLVGVLVKGGEIQLARLDARGALADARAVPSTGRAREHATALFVDAAGERIAVVLGDDVISTVAIADLRTLAPIARTPDLSGWARAGAFDGRGSLLLANTTDRTIEMVSLAGADVAARFRLPSARPVTHDLGYISRHESGWMLLSSTARELRDGALWVLETAWPPSGRLLGEGVFYESSGSPWASISWPGSSNRALVAISGPLPEVPVALALFDVAARHFIPGSRRVGRGLVSSFAAGDGGRIFALLPWEAKLLRITPP